MIDVLKSNKKEAPKLSTVLLDRFFISQCIHSEKTKASCLNLHLNSIAWNVSAIPRGINKDSILNVGIIHQQAVFLCRTVEGNLIGVSVFPAVFFHV